MPVKASNPGYRGPRVADMTRKEFYRKFSAEEWELLCSKDEFLDVFADEPFNSEKAEEVANKILNLDSH